MSLIATLNNIFVTVSGVTLGEIIINHMIVMKRAFKFNVRCPVPSRELGRSSLHRGGVQSGGHLRFARPLCRASGIQPHRTLPSQLHPVRSASDQHVNMMSAVLLLIEQFEVGVLDLDYHHLEMYHTPWP